MGKGALTAVSTEFALALAARHKHYKKTGGGGLDRCSTELFQIFMPTLLSWLTETPLDGIVDLSFLALYFFQFASTVASHSKSVS
jgi:hypothetical protein